MKNSKRNGMGVSEHASLQSTANSRQLREAGEREGRGERQEGRAKARPYTGSVRRPCTGNNWRRRGTGERGGRGAQKEVDAGALWKQIEDAVVPRLRLSVIDHVIYVHLLRHSHLEGKRRLRFSIPWLAHNINLSTCPTREAVRRLAACSVVRLVERSKAGHVAEVRLPEEVRGVRAAAAARAREAARKAVSTDIEELDFMKKFELRKAIHARERGRCFYCLRRVAPRLECLDHVVPRARVGCNSYRNLVSACMECNAQKGEQPAEEYLRWLFREHRLGAAELRGRFEALEMLGAGKLKPAIAGGVEAGSKVRRKQERAR